MVALVLVPVSVAVGFVVGVLAAPLAVPYVGEVPRPNRVLLGLATAALFGVLAWRVGGEPVLPALLYLAAAGALLGYIDLSVRRLPDRFTLPSYGIAAALLAAAAPFTHHGPQRIEHALIGMAALFAVYFTQAMLIPSGIGLGDVKLSGVLGLYLGWYGQHAWIIGLLTTYLLGGLIALTIMITRRSRKGEFPFGPSMLTGALIAVLSAVG